MNADKRRWGFVLGNRSRRTGEGEPPGEPLGKGDPPGGARLGSPSADGSPSRRSPYPRSLARLRRRSFLLLSVTLIGCGPLLKPSDAPVTLPARPAGARIRSLDEVPQLKESEVVDVARVLALLAHEQDPRLDPRSVEKAIAHKARKIRRGLLRKAGPKNALRLLSRHVLAGLKVRPGDVQANKPEDLNLHHVIETRRGTCISFTALYVAVAQRAGLPVWGVYARRHIFPRFQDDKHRANVETVAAGKRLPDKHYIEHYELKPEAIAQGLVLRSLTHREFVSYVLCAYGAALADAGNGDGNSNSNENERAGRYLQLAVAIAPANAVARHNLAVFLHSQKRDSRRALEQLNEALRQDPYLIDAYLARGRILRDQRRFTAALADAVAAAQLSPEASDARLLRAEIHGLAGNLPAAAAECRAVLAKDRKNPRALYLMARLLAIARQPDQALAYLKKAIKQGARDFHRMRRLNDFQSLHDEPRFRELVGLGPKP